MASAEGRRRRRTTTYLMLTAALMAVYSGVLWWNGPTSNHEMFPVFNRNLSIGVCRGSMRIGWMAC